MTSINFLALARAALSLTGELCPDILSTSTDNLQEYLVVVLEEEP
jgi:hypothetical protein